MKVKNGAILVLAYGIFGGMRLLSDLFKNNRKWADRMERDHPGFFRELVAQQAPQFLWIGCSDSRVPANEIVAETRQDSICVETCNAISRSGGRVAILEGWHET